MEGLLLALLLTHALGQSGGQPYRAASADNLDLTNAFRARQGLGALARDANLDKLAMQWSKHMYLARRMFHSQYNLAENVAAAFGSYTKDSVSQGFYSQWENSAGHRANMLRASSTCGGVGIYGDGRTFYGTQVFATSCAGAGAPQAPRSVSAPRTPAPVGRMTPAPMPAPTAPTPVYSQMTPEPLPGPSPMEPEDGADASPEAVPMSRDERRLKRAERRLLRLKRRLVMCLARTLFGAREMCDKIRERIEALTTKVGSPRRRGAVAVA